MFVWDKHLKTAKNQENIKAAVTIIAVSKWDKPVALCSGSLSVGTYSIHIPPTTYLQPHSTLQGC